MHMALLSTCPALLLLVFGGALAEVTQPHHHHSSKEIGEHDGTQLSRSSKKSHHHSKDIKMVEVGAQELHDLDEQSTHHMQNADSGHQIYTVDAQPSASTLMRTQRTDGDPFFDPEGTHETRTHPHPSEVSGTDPVWAANHNKKTYGDGWTQPAASTDSDGWFDRRGEPSNDHSTNPHSLEQAEQELEKIDKVVLGAEREAGMVPTATDTPDTEEEVDAEEGALMWIALALISLCCVWSAGWGVVAYKILGPEKWKPQQQVDETEGEDQGEGENDESNEDEARQAPGQEESWASSLTFGLLG